MKIRIILSILSLLSVYSFPSQADEKNFPTYEIMIKSARGLSETDAGKNDKTDPYAILYVRSDAGNNKYFLREISRTKVIYNTNNPKWDYTTKFTPRDPHEMTGKFMVRIADEDKKLPRDLDIGCFIFQYTHDVEDKVIQSDNSSVNIINLMEGFRFFSPRAVWNTITGQKVRPGTLTISIKKMNPNITVPNFTGQRWDEIQSRIENDDSLNWVYRAQILTDESKDGVILGQIPAPGASVKYGSTVGISVGRIQKISVPGFTNLRLPDVLLRMRSLNLKLGEKTYKETSNPRLHGKVAGQSPAPGTTVKVPSSIDIETFKYVQPEPVDFPDIMGLTYDEAYNELRDGGLSVGAVTKKPVDEKSGVVVATNPAWEKGMTLPPGTRVSLVLAAPELLGTSMAFPIAKQPNEMITLDFNKGKEYYLKLTVDQKGYVRFIDPEGSQTLPLSGIFFIPGEETIARYSSWDDRRIFKVLPQEYYMKFSWSNMTRKTKDNAIVNFKYQIVPEMDPAEPNDTIHEATNIAAGVRNDIAIYPGDESDWFTYTADADGYLRLTIEDVPDEIDHAFMFEVYEEGSEKNLHTAEYLPVSVKVFKDKKYFIRISILGKDRSPKTFGVTLDLALEKDPTEPNDTINTAYPLEGDYSGIFYFMGKAEHDWFKAYPPAWARYMVISTRHPEGLMIPRVYWGRTEEELKNSDYVKTAGYPVTIPIEPSEPYYLHMYNEHILKYSDIPFDLSISYFPGSDLNNKNTSLETAIPIKVNEDTNIVLAPPGNEDWFSFSTNGNQELFVDIPNMVDEDIKCRLLDEQGKVIKSIILSNETGNNKIIVPKTGKHYLQVYFDYPNISSHREMVLKLMDKNNLDSLVKQGVVPVPEIEQEKVSNREMSISLAKKAYEHLEKSEYQQSIDLYKQAIDLYEDQRYWHDMGIAYFSQKKWEEAKKCFEKAIGIEPNYFLAHKSLGSVYGELKDYKTSLKEFKAALSLKRDDPILYYNMARSYEGMHIIDNSDTDALREAYRFSKKALNKIPDNEKVKIQYTRIKQKISLIDKN